METIVPVHPLSSHPRDPTVELEVGLGRLPRLEHELRYPAPSPSRTLRPPPPSVSLDPATESRRPVLLLPMLEVGSHLPSQSPPPPPPPHSARLLVLWDCRYIRLKLLTHLELPSLGFSYQICGYLVFYHVDSS